MIFEKRLDIIMDLLKEDEKVSNKELLDTLNISESTLRRDLDYLEETGRIKRVYGGAVINRLEEETNFSFNESFHTKEKQLIGKKASEMIEAPSHIFIDGGTTTYQMLDYIENKNVTVVTNGLMHLKKLTQLHIPTILLGGEVKESTFITCGDMAIRDLSNMNFDIAFLGANGIYKDTYSTADIKEANIKRTAIVKASKSYVLADSSKIGKKYFVDFATFSDATLIKEDE